MLAASVRFFCSKNGKKISKEIQNKLSGRDMEAIARTCNETIHWLDTNQCAELHQFEDKQNEVDLTFNPVMVMLYGQPGGSNMPHEAESAVSTAKDSPV